MNEKQRKSLLVALIIFCGLLLWSAGNAQTWRKFDTGIKQFFNKDITIIKIDQTIYNFSGAGNNLNPKPLTYWLKDNVGAINLNMFVAGYIPRGYTKLNNKVIQPEFKSDYNAFIVWDKDTLRIMDRQRDSMEEILSYPNVSQNIRMMWSKTKDKNRWQDDNKMWSVSALGATKDGDILFIHSRAPYTMHQFNDLLLFDDEYLNIDMLVYLEGGPECGIIVKGKKYTISNVGSYETGFNEYYDNIAFWPVPWALTFNKK